MKGITSASLEGDNRSGGRRYMENQAPFPLSPTTVDVFGTIINGRPLVHRPKSTTTGTEFVYIAPSPTLPPPNHSRVVRIGSECYLTMRHPEVTIAAAESAPHTATSNRSRVVGAR